MTITKACTQQAGAAVHCNWLHKLLCARQIPDCRAAACMASHELVLRCIAQDKPADCPDAIRVALQDLAASGGITLGRLTGRRKVVLDSGPSLPGLVSRRHASLHMDTEALEVRLSGVPRLPLPSAAAIAAADFYCSAASSSPQLTTFRLQHKWGLPERCEGDTRAASHFARWRHCQFWGPQVSTACEGHP